MKVSNINMPVFKGNNQTVVAQKSVATNNNVRELNNVTPDFNVKVPQKYYKTGVEKIPNGLEVHSYKLANGYRVSIIPMEGSPAMVKNYVSVGSLNETDDIKGISHFLEHMAFNGTNGENGYIKLNTGDSFKKIDELGGWTNASTSYAVTDYVNSTPLLNDKDLETQLKIIAGMTEDLALTDKMIEKEKGPVCSEINMILDDPQTIAMDQTVRTLFNIKSSADELIAGSVEHIKNLNRTKIKNYYDKYYTPENMNLVITGDVNPDEVIRMVASNFKSQKTAQGKRYEEKLTPIQNSVRKDFINDKATSTEIVLGFEGPKNNDAKEGLIFAILSDYISSTSVGLAKELKELNAGGGINSEKISNNPNNPRILYYYANSSEENSEKVLNIVYNKLANLKPPTQKELDNIKRAFLIDVKDIMDYSSAVNNMVGNAILNDKFGYLTNYAEILDSITTDDIDKFIKKYIDVNKAAITVVHPQTTKENIVNNYTKANNVSFHGKQRQALDLNEITQKDLDNGYKLALCNTKNDNKTFKVSLYYDYPEWANPAATFVLNSIYDNGTKNMSEDEFKQYEEDNNIGVSQSVSTQSLSLVGTSADADFDKAFKLSKDLLYSPNITEKEVNKAIQDIRDSLGRLKDTSGAVFNNYESKNDRYRISKQEILDGLDTITVEDVKKLHNYIINNSYGSIAMNYSKENNSKEQYVNTFSQLRQVQPFEYKVKNVYKDNLNPVVNTKSTNNSQADILQTYKYQISQTPKEIATLDILNTLLSSSSSIGLFNTLREKEHLAYSVSSDYSNHENCGYLSCNILTTTDDKNDSEKSYDNVQKSINGFHRQINCLLNSEYTDEDFESAKRKLKAELLNSEGVSSKLGRITGGIHSEFGINRINEIYNEIDNISREDISNMANTIFKNPPIYSIVATQDTLDANKEYFDKLAQGNI